jgi:hypothetical protein
MCLEHKSPQQNNNTITQYTGPAVLLCGSETGTVKERGGRRITAAEMKCMGITAGYTWTDYKTNTLITKQLK